MIPFTKVLVNLELLVNEKFFVCGTICKILLTLKSLYVKGYKLTQKLDPVIGRLYLC